MITVLKALNRHKSINAITRGVSALNWPRWEAQSKLIHFDKSELLSPGRHYPDQLIFPTTAIFSFSSESSTGGLAESSLTGSEGVVGLWMLAPKPYPSTGFKLQTEGFGLVVPADFLNIEIAVSSDFRLAILSYAGAMVRYATQTCFCYRYHSIEQQVIKTILLTVRRTGRHEVDMTHQALGEILGLRREAISSAVRHLHDLALISQKRGRIVVLRLDELEAASCECYHAICGFLRYHELP
jgi:hypothetical protein